MLAEMLTYRRPHDSLGEQQFIDRYIAPHTTPVTDPKDGTVHAYTVRIPLPGGAQSGAVFCAHTDSVHNRQNPEPRQKVSYDSARREFFISDPAQRDCLGADDAAGCYVMLRMIEDNVPGLYVFFRGEERGGIGSSYVADHRPDIFEHSQYAIQFDRRGTRSIITHMMVGRTCSDAFAESLADLLDMGHVCDPTGSFTDTANLAGILPECTNISIGYENEHSRDETLNAGYVHALTAAMIRAFSTAPLLDGDRHPGDYDITPYPARRRDDAPLLMDMTDEDIHDLAHWADPETMALILIAARDELWADYV